MATNTTTPTTSKQTATKPTNLLRQRKTRFHLADVVKQVTALSSSEREKLVSNATSNNNNHKTGLLQSVELPSMLFAQDDNQASNTTSLLDNAERMERHLFDAQQQQDEDLLERHAYTQYQNNQYQYQYQNQHQPPDEERPSSSSALETSPLLAQQQQQQQQQPPPRPNRCRKWWQSFITLVHPQEMLHAVESFLLYWVLGFMLPCLLLAAVLFYGLDNPNTVYLPTGYSWFLLLLIRLAVTFNLARVSQWILQLLTVKTGFLARTAGPLVALIAMQSQGWPFVLSAWGLWNMLLLHGNTHFVRHWLYFAHVELFSIKYNAGNGFLASETYGRMLLAVMVIGITVSIKRTFVALFLSRRMLAFYRPQLEIVMAQVKIVMEVAELAQETEREGFDQILKDAKHAAQNRVKRFAEAVPTFEPTTVARTSTSSAMNDDDEEDTDDDHHDNKKDKDNDDEPEDIYEALAEGEEDDSNNEAQWQALKQRAMNDRYTMKFNDHEDDGDGYPSSAKGNNSQGRQALPGMSRSSSRGLDTVYQFLERWQEPEDKGSKKAVPTLHDILQFKKAMAFLNGELNIISHSFGETPNRRALVKNAVKLYRRLQRFAPDQAVLPFDVIGSLAYTSEGSLDEEKAVSLLRVFLPDNDDRVPMMAFVQAVDHIYKKMRFLRASLSNASKIDTVLENIFNVVFYAILAVSTLSVLGFNPWPLLLSFSTFAISFAFAFGSSVAKSLEGVLLIAVRRPFDIGDRISICGAESVAHPGTGDTWLVEDISLTTTTLRYAATNEVATINNASIANSRIVNGSRSPKASVTFRIMFDISTATAEKMDEFRMKIESYLEDRPRIWVSPLIHYRTEQVDSDNGFVTWMYRAQHVKSWQELGWIMIHKGELERFADTLATDMGIVLSTPPRRMNVGLGLAPIQTASADEDRERMKEILKSIKED